MNIILAVIFFTAALPLLFGILCGLRYRSCPMVPKKIVAMLYAASVLSLMSISTCPGFLSMKSTNVLLLSGTMVTSVLFLAFSIRRIRSLPLGWLMVCLLAVEIALLAGVDHRFRIVIRDPDGEPVAVRDGDMVLGHAGSSFGASFIEIRKGTKLGKGEYYFGLLRWLKRKGDYTFCGKFHDPNGNLLGDLKFQRAKWSEWPKHVIVNPAREE